MAHSDITGPTQGAVPQEGTKVTIRYALLTKVAAWLRREPRATVRQAAAIYNLTGSEMHLLAQWAQL